ncbi:MAG TPA: efflux RND transporter periplasmic adaptor subunit [Deferrisomatales bacterium]|nr:efflux RND transporter periplasmic adaptor subunit [Deferrisomatales bacterium]
MSDRMIRALTLPLLLGSLALVASGCSEESHGDTGATPQATVEPQPAKATNVSIRRAARVDVRETFTLPGTLEAWEDITLGLEQAGPILWIGPREGDRIGAGDPILRIDPETLEAQLQSAQVDHDLARRQLERMELLLEKRLVSQQEGDQAREAFEAARSRLKQTRLAVEKSTLISPIDGVLDELLVDRGEYGAIGAPAAVVVQVDRLKVLVDVPEKDVPFLQAGRKARVSLATIDTVGEKFLPGEIVHVAYRADPRTSTYRAKVAVDNAAGKLRPGMIVRVQFDRVHHRGVVTVPLYSLLDRDGHKELYVEQDGIARRRTVRTGPVIDGRIIIQTGLEPGERLIVAGQQLVGDGSAVQVVEEAGKLEG